MSKIKKTRRNTKIPFNRSIRAGVVYDFEKICIEMEVNKNELVEALLKEFILQKLTTKKFQSK